MLPDLVQDVANWTDNMFSVLRRLANRAEVLCADRLHCSWNPSAGSQSEHRFNGSVSSGALCCSQRNTLNFPAAAQSSMYKNKLKVKVFALKTTTTRD